MEELRIIVSVLVALFMVISLWRSNLDVIPKIYFTTTVIFYLITVIIHIITIMLEEF